MSAKLFIYTRQKHTFPEALSAFAGISGSQSATAILYTPRRCELATFTNGILHGSDGQPLDMANIFEARVFHELAELRWLNDPSPTQNHRTVILTAQEQTTLIDWHLETVPQIIEKISQTYLLWGEGTGRKLINGWSELATARIGGLRIPVGNLGRNQRVLLNSVEYIVEADHGNAVIFDERLLNLEVDHG